MNNDKYAEIYRRMHPRVFPYSPYERQMELSDLWPSEQARIKREIDATAELILDTPRMILQYIQGKEK